MPQMLAVICGLGQVYPVMCGANHTHSVHIVLFQSQLPMRIHGAAWLQMCCSLTQIILSANALTVLCL